MQTCAICAIAKDEGSYIREWVDFHIGIGFDHITIYDNESTDGGMHSIMNLSNVTVVPWPDAAGRKAQNTAYIDFFEKESEKYDWVMLLDIDEFVNLKNHRNIKEFVLAFCDFDGVAINWRMFGSSGCKEFSNEPVLARFTRASFPGFGPNAHVKTIFRPSAVECPYVHSPLFKKGHILVDCLGRILDDRRADIVNHNIDISVAQINHYFTKSQVEFTSKVRRGKADHAQDSPERYRTLEEFKPYDRNEEEDTSILRLI